MICFGENDRDRIWYNSLTKDAHKDGESLLIIVDYLCSWPLKYK